MRLRVRHTFDFGSERDRVGSTLLRPEAWDAARTADERFAFPPNREMWEQSARTDELRARGRDIVTIAHGLGAEALGSYGAGTGMLEWNLHLEAPDLRLFCADYAPLTIERLEELFPEASCVRHDLAADDPLPVDLHLMHRLDAELSDDEWPVVLARYREPVLFVPNLLLDVRSAAQEIARRLARRHLTDAGWFRSPAAMRRLWSGTHDDRAVRVGSQASFLLFPR